MGADHSSRCECITDQLTSRIDGFQVSGPNFTLLCTKHMIPGTPGVYRIDELPQAIIDIKSTHPELTEVSEKAIEFLNSNINQFENYVRILAVHLRNDNDLARFVIAYLRVCGIAYEEYTPSNSATSGINLYSEAPSNSIFQLHGIVEEDSSTDFGWEHLFTEQAVFAQYKSVGSVVRRIEEKEGRKPNSLMINGRVLHLVQGAYEDLFLGHFRDTTEEDITVFYKMNESE